MLIAIQENLTEQMTIRPRLRFFEGFRFLIHFSQDSIAKIDDMGPGKDNVELKKIINRKIVVNRDGKTNVQFERKVAHLQCRVNYCLFT